jgi:hypothetical protein
MRLLLWAGGARIAAFLVVALPALERAPRVAREVAFTADQIERAKRIVDTRRAPGTASRCAAAFASRYGITLRPNSSVAA